MTRCKTYREAKKKFKELTGYDYDTYLRTQFGGMKIFHRKKRKKGYQYKYPYLIGTELDWLNNYR